MTGPGEDRAPRSARGLARVALVALGWACVGLGVAGAFLPVLPTTPFLLVALWAFARSSQRFHDWLFDHPRLGPPLRRWQRHRVIPLRVKVFALSAMGVSLTGVVTLSAAPWYLVAAMAAIMAVGAAVILGKPSRPPPGSGEAEPPAA